MSQQRIQRRDFLTASGRTLLAGAAATFAPGVLAGCGGDGGSAKTGGSGLTTLRIGYQSASDYGLFYVARQKGWFKKVGVDARLSMFDTGDPEIEGLSGGSLDIGLMGSVPPLIGASQGLSAVRLVAPLADAAGLFSIVADGSLKDVPSLVGHRVAVTKGTAYEFYLDAVLQKFGLGASQIEKVDLQPLDGQGAFLARKVDALVPIATSRFLILDKRPDAKVIFDAAGFGKAPNPTTFSIYDTMIASERAIKDKKEAITRLTRTYFGQVSSYVTAPSTSAKAIDALTSWQENVAKAPTSKKAVKQQIEGYKFYDTSQVKQIVSSGEFAKQLTEQAKFLVRTGQIHEMPPLDQVVDTSIAAAL